MAILSVRDLTFGFGGEPLFDGAELQIEAGERVCLLGRNGEGKSTFLRLIGEEIEAPPGTIARRKGLRVAILSQQVPEGLTGTIYEVVSAGLGARGDLLRRHHEVTESLSTGTVDESLLAELERLQEEIDTAGAWEAQRDVDRALSKLSLDPDATVAELSAGNKRRVLLARALISQPDLLLLDEPTNHLDLDGIAWLEEFLPRFEGTLLFVTHDRAFLRRVANRILELDRGQLRSWDCGYEAFLERRAEVLHAEDKEWDRLDKKLAQEEAWIRKGIRARRTRNEGRVRALEKLREERRARRERTGRLKAAVHEGKRSGQKVIEAKNIAFGYEGKPIVKDFSAEILRGDKIGLIGPNGSGKTTLLKLLLGELTPQRGELKHGTKLDVAYFDQLHAQLDDDKTLIENVSDGEDFVEIGGSRRHITGYLQDFLFSPERIRGRLGDLSGGERNRLLLARLFIRPANVLVLDEPTNDLDLESLEVLEDLLLEYSGTVLLVSHDREFLDNVVTSSFVFEGAGEVHELVGGYDAWMKRRANQQEIAEAASVPKKSAPAPRKAKKEAGSRGLSYKEKQELETLPPLIEKLEGEIARWHEKMADPEFYQQGGDAIAQAKEALAAAEGQLAVAYERWEELEERA